MPVAKIDGTSIAYDVTGVGPPLVMLHCWTGSKNFYFNQVAKFAQNYKCISLDFPGHGESGESVSNDYSVECLGEMTVELLKQLGVKKAVFAGHSLGGMVALYLGLHYVAAVPATTAFVALKPVSQSTAPMEPRTATPTCWRTCDTQTGWRRGCPTRCCSSCAAQATWRSSRSPRL